MITFLCSTPMAAGGAAALRRRAARA